MKTSDGNSPYRTDLKPVDHEQFFEAIHFPPSSTEALHAAFRKQKEILSKPDADPLITD